MQKRIKKNLRARNAHRRFGMPDAIRTHDLQSRSLTLYPAELRAHIFCCFSIIHKVAEKVKRNLFICAEKSTKAELKPEKER